jgi:ABC-2 type transport system ATP-binding protein
VTSIVTTQYVTEAEECNLVALISDGRRIAFGSPEELRRSALGGEVLEVTTTNVFDGASLQGNPGLIAVRQSGPRDLRVVVEDAGTASADIVHAIAEAGAEVDSIREVRLSFDEVFAELVGRDQASRPRSDGEDSAARGKSKPAGSADSTDPTDSAEAA